MEAMVTASAGLEGTRQALCPSQSFLSPVVLSEHLASVVAHCQGLRSQCLKHIHLEILDHYKKKKEKRKRILHSMKKVETYCEYKVA